MQELDEVTGQVITASADDQTVVVAVLPFYHVYGMMIGTVASGLNGSKIIVIPKFEPVVFLETIQKYKVTTDGACVSLRVHARAIQLNACFIIL